MSPEDEVHDAENYDHNGSEGEQHTGTTPQGIVVKGDDHASAQSSPRGFMVSALSGAPGPAVRTMLCTAAVSLIGAAASVLVYGIEGGAVTMFRVALCGVGIAVGAALVHAGHCLEQ